MSFTVICVFLLSSQGETFKESLFLRICRFSLLKRHEDFCFVCLYLRYPLMYVRTS